MTWLPPRKLVSALLAAAFLAGCQGRPPGRSSAGGPDLLTRSMVWVDDAGEELPLPTEQELVITPVASADDTQSAVWRLDLPVHEMHRLQRLRLELQSDVPARLRLGWIESADPALHWGPSALAVEGHQSLELAPAWELPTASSPTALALHASPPSAVTLIAAYLQASPGPGAAWVHLDGVARRSLVLRPSVAAQWNLTVGPHARLEFSYGVAESAWEGGGDGSFFQLQAGRVGDEPRVLWQDALDPLHDRAQRRWFAASVDLEAFAGQEIVLRLSARGSPPREAPFDAFDDPRNDAPVVGAPKLVGGAAAPNVLIVLVDTLRRDELGGYGAPTGASEALDALLARSAVFDAAYATGPWTHPSTASLLTGLLPSAHGLGTSPSGVSWFHPGVMRLAEPFQAAGYATAAISNNIIVSPAEGFAPGLDCFDTRPFESSQVYGAERMTRFALQWLREPRTAPFFLYLHYFDPHDRYQAPPPHTRAFVDPEDAAAVQDERVLAGQVNPMVTRLYRDGQRTDYDPPAAEVAVLRGLYRGEIEYTDAWIGRLLEEMDAAGLLENTVVVFTADHGEEFLDHGYLKHGQGLYDELIRVPLAIRFPDGVGRGEQVATPVSLIDVAPTLLSYCGLEGPALPGQDLYAGLRDEGVASRPVFAVSYGGQARSGSTAHGPKQAAMEGRWKLIHSLADDRLELFDTAEDPRELHDVSAAHPDEAERLRALASRALAGETEAAPPLTPEMLEKLKALGYVH